jgi:pimeloyl-ACP methyl ester carboxylesterase
MADSLLDVLDGLGLDKVNLVGNSLGAMTAVEFAATYPDRIRKLVLVGCPGWDGRYRTERMRARGTAPQPQMSTTVSAADLAPTFTAPTDELARNVSLSRQQSERFNARGSNAVMGHDTLGRSFSVTAPTLLLCGERDIVVPDQPRFLRSIVGSKLVILKGAAHYPQVDVPDRFISTVLDFLQE